MMYTEGLDSEFNVTSSYLNWIFRCLWGVCCSQNGDCILVRLEHNITKIFL